MHPCVCPLNPCPSHRFVRVTNPYGFTSTTLSAHPCSAANNPLEEQGPGGPALCTSAGNAAHGSAATLAPPLQRAPSAAPSTHARPDRGSVDTAAAAAAAARLDALRSFAGCCSVLFGKAVLPAGQLDNATREELAAALIQQLGAEALGDLSVSVGGGTPRRALECLASTLAPRLAVSPRHAPPARHWPCLPHAPHACHMPATTLAHMLHSAHVPALPRLPARPTAGQCIAHLPGSRRTAGMSGSGWQVSSPLGQMHPSVHSKPRPTSLRRCPAARAAPTFWPCTPVVSHTASQWAQWDGSGTQHLAGISGKALPCMCTAGEQGGAAHAEVLPSSWVPVVLHTCKRW